MTEEELKAALQTFYDGLNDIGISVYAILKDDSDFEPQKIDIEASAETSLKDLFIDYLQENISQKESLSVLNFSSADERMDAIYVYDMTIPDELKAIDEVTNSDSLPLLDLNNHTLRKIRSLIIEIGNNESQMVLYKTIAPINIFGRNSFFLKKHNTRMEQIDDEFLRISANFQLLKIAGKLLVLDLEAIEKSFGFDEIIKKEGTQGVAAVEEMQLVENPEVLHELLEEVKYAKKLAKVAKASPVRNAGVPNSSIINFCKNFPGLKGKIKFNANENKIWLDTNVSKNLFIKLMMDDFLTSELTSYHYESVAKDRADANDGVTAS